MTAINTEEINNSIAYAATNGICTKVNIADDMIIANIVLDLLKIALITPYLKTSSSVKGTTRIEAIYTIVYSSIV
jgi:hypothetical protein